MGGLECSGSCLSSKTRAYGSGTQVNIPGPVLHLLELPTAGSPAGPSLSLPRIPEALSPLAILYV